MAQKGLYFRLDEVALLVSDACVPPFPLDGVEGIGAGAGEVAFDGEAQCPTASAFSIAYGLEMPFCLACSGLFQAVRAIGAVVHCSPL